ncbi:MAG: Cys-Gln thioester bond-forming surface protein [Candidatus Dormibacteraeota bacterium]|nr:Cys-Gln thioester bond-forming surface protein [Candidatus Dormibacteraeota bacterium]
MTGLGPGHQGILGHLAPGIDPISGYPPDPSIYPVKNEYFAGVINAKNTSTGAALQAYCIDLHTATFPGLGYALGTWDASNVPNVGYVARILNEFYPHVPNAPAGAPTPDAKAAAVQAAIWFFTDNYVLDVADPVHPYTVGIVNQVLAEGPLTPPVLPLTITGPSTGPAGMAIGPFTINTTAATVTVSVTGGSLFSDSAMTHPVPNGSTIASSTPLFLLRSSPGPASIDVTANIMAATGEVLLYEAANPENPDPVAAQKLILASEGEVTKTVSVQVTAFDTGSLTVTKTIGGPASGLQGQVIITVTCNSVALEPFVIPAGATGSVSKTYHNIETPATCVITETADGANASLTAQVTNASQTIQIPADQTPDNGPSPAPTPILDVYQKIPELPNTGSGPGGGWGFTSWLVALLALLSLSAGGLALAIRHRRAGFTRP